MEYTTLGTTPSSVSRLGYGCLAMSGHHYGPVSDEESTRAVQRACSLGVTLFDTADVYGFGHAEELLGRALGGRKRWRGACVGSASTVSPCTRFIGSITARPSPRR